MNLEDYAYQEGDRWYVNPQVSLDEQNAFINNLRSLQAQDNAQIEQQTRALGTQVPSHLGGLTGAGGYFRSRYQTPQTNQTIADLRSAAQGTALQSVLQSEINKYKKLYNDARNRALTSSAGGTNGLTGNRNPLTIEEKDDGSSDTFDTKYDRTEEKEVEYDSPTDGLLSAYAGQVIGSMIPGLGIWGPIIGGLYGYRKGQGN